MEIGWRVDKTFFDFSDVSRKAEHRSAPSQVAISTLQFPSSSISHIRANRFAAVNTEMAARTRIAVLRGVKEQVALYLSRQALLVFESGIKVLIAAMLRAIIMKIEITVSAFIVLFHPHFDFSVVSS